MAGTTVPPMSNQPLLVVSSLRKAYHRGSDRVQAIDDVTFHCETGCFSALAGPSGSGKSSLLNIIGTLDCPDSGSVHLEGSAINYSNNEALERLRQHRLGFVFQNFNLLPTLTALENVELPLLITPLSTTMRQQRATACLDAVGLGDRLHHFPRQLSGGQQQRVAVARALVSDPVLVLADEPTANLDSHTAESLLSLMHHLNQERGVGFLFSTHDPRVLDTARTVITLHDGKIAS